MMTEALVTVPLFYGGEGMQTKAQALAKLKRSKFRSSFHLRKADLAYVQEKGMDVITDHARHFVQERLAPAEIANDGKQTPMKGHPVFLAQHATATCCRGCLHKWYKVQEHTQLTAVQQEKIVSLIMAWIEEEVQENTEKDTANKQCL